METASLHLQIVYPWFQGGLVPLEETKKLLPLFLPGLHYIVLQVSPPGRAPVCARACVRALPLPWHRAPYMEQAGGKPRRA